MSNIPKGIGSRFSNKENDKDVNLLSDINSQYHFVKSDDFKRNKISQEFDIKSNLSRLKMNQGYRRSDSSDICDSNLEYTNEYCGLLKKYKWKFKCPNCYGNSSVYYCGDCIKAGNFYHSSGKIPERYADKRLRERKLRSQACLLGQRALVEMPQCLKKEKLKREIERVRERIRLIQKVIETERRSTIEARQNEQILQNYIYGLKKTLPRFQKKNADLSQNIELYSERIPRKYEIVAGYEKEFQLIVRNQIRQLMTVLFPFSRIKSEKSPEEDSENQDMVKDLAEATQTHYVDGKWITLSHFPQDRNYSILSAVLPGSGNYSSFMLADGMDTKREANNICAGLSFLTQIISIIAGYLNIHLPKKVKLSDFGDFSMREMEDKNFQKLVARLNSNVLYLCISQGVPASSIYPFRPLHNLMALLTEKNDLGRCGNFEFPDEVIRCLDDIEQYDLFPDSDSDGEWETVNAGAIPDISANPSSHRQSPFEETASGIVTSAAASVLSMFGIGNR